MARTSKDFINRFIDKKIDDVIVDDLKLNIEQLVYEVSRKFNVVEKSVLDRINFHVESDRCLSVVNNILFFNPMEVQNEVKV